MDSNLFGSGIPKFTINSTTVDINNSFIESILPEGRTIEDESIINATRNWTDITSFDHITITVLVRLHKITNSLSWFKNFYENYNRSEVDAFYPSQNSDAFVDKDGELVKFRMEITELFPLEKIWSYDTFRVIFKSKKPVDLSKLAVYVADEYTIPVDSAGTRPVDTAGTRPKDSGDE